jgi:hypothetical protein
MGQSIKIAYPYHSKNSIEILLVVDFWNPLYYIFFPCILVFFLFCDSSKLVPKIKRNTKDLIEIQMTCTLFRMREFYSNCQPEETLVRREIVCQYIREIERPI